MAARRSRIPFVLVLIVIATGLPAIAVFYTDWLWFKEVGYEQVFIRSLTARSTVTTVAAAVVFAILAINLFVTFRSLYPRQFVIATAVGPQSITVDPNRVRPLALMGAGLVALVTGLFAGSQWEQWLYFIYATPFGKADPILGRDVGFYVFTLPALEMVHGMLFTTLVLATVATVGGLRPRRRGGPRSDARPARFEDGCPSRRHSCVAAAAGPRRSAPGSRFRSC